MWKSLACKRKNGKVKVQLGRDQGPDLDVEELIGLQQEEWKG
jgi:hypothetical protein